MIADRRHGATRSIGPLVATVAAALGLTVVGVSALAPAAAAPAAFCDRVDEGAIVGTLADPDLDEVSGLAASRAHPGVLWVLEDSGAEAELHAIDATGATVGTRRVPGARNVDWEDLAIGPGPDVGASYLYIADIGDNGAVRSTVTVYRVPEPVEAPTGAEGSLDGVEAFTLRYPDGPADAEALLVDPISGDLVVVTKGLLGATVLRAPATDLVDGRTTTLTDVGSVSVPLVTAADIAPDGSAIVLRNYLQVVGFDRPTGTSVADALGGDSCQAEQLRESQGEAIAFSATGDAYLTTSEGVGARIHRFALEPNPTTDTTGGGPSTGGTAADPSGDPAVPIADDGSPLRAVPVAIVVVAALAAVTILSRRRRDRPGRPRRRDRWPDPRR